MARKPILLNPHRIKDLRESRSQRLLTIKSVRESIISFAGLSGKPVRNQNGSEIGRLVDVVVRWSQDSDYPPVTGILVKVGRRIAFVDIDRVEMFSRDFVVLSSAKLDLRDFSQRPGEVLLGREVLDHQLVDVDGVQVLRAADLFLAHALGRIRLVGVDVSMYSLLRRLGPSKFRSAATPEKVLDWAAIAPFDDHTGEVRLRSTQQAIKRLRPSELADLLEDLGRVERQGLLSALDIEIAADAVEEMERDERETLLRESEPEVAADIVSAMEPDEAVEALRDLDEDERHEILELMEPNAARALGNLLEFEEDTAGGVMTTMFIKVLPNETVENVKSLLEAHRDHRDEIDGVLVVDDEGLLLGEVSLFELVLSSPTTAVSELISEDSVVVEPNVSISEVAEKLISSRQFSIVVAVDQRPVGRILADDIIDALSPERGRFHFPRLLS
ncbi:MAG: magnesium transporter [Acidimicrobiaceae bacterium]|nr:magnesium transporter [Acidimicrobiaceae bacterium]